MVMTSVSVKYGMDVVTVVGVGEAVIVVIVKRVFNDVKVVV